MPPADPDDPRLRSQELEQELRAARAGAALLGTVLESIPAIVVRVGADGLILYVNRVLPEHEADPPVGRSIYSYVPAEQHGVMRLAIDGVMAGGLPAEYEVIVQAPDGTRDWYHTAVTPIHDAGRVIGVTLTCTNTSRLRRIEEQLRESQGRVALALDAGNVGLWSWDRAQDRVTWDDKLCAMFGLAPAQAPTTVAAFLAIVSDDQRAVFSAHLEAALRTGHHPDFELRVDADDGIHWYLVKGGLRRSASGGVVGLLGGVVDDTERRRLLEHVREAQKLDAVGQLAAGVAHNFNNMLAGIIPVLELAARSAAAPLDELLREAHQRALRASVLVRDLMLVSRSDAAGAGTAGHGRQLITEVLQRVVVLCQRTFPRALTIETSIDASASHVWVDGVQVEQALLNMLLNARDALEHTDPLQARITISSAPPSAPDRARGIKTVLQVRDTGCGMDEATRARVFEPFFTTKPVGAGTGLGLATAWATIKAHGGSIACSSVPDRGTVFTLSLPSLSPSAPSAPPAPAAPAGPQTGLTGARVLLIDDDPTVRRVTEQALTSLGYRVATAASGPEGVAAFRGERVDAVILDHSMPGQPGDVTLAQLRALDASVPVIVFSGLRVELAGASAYLAKPATLLDLSAALGRLLGR